MNRFLFPVLKKGLQATFFRRLALKILQSWIFKNILNMKD